MTQVVVFEVARCCSISRMVLFRIAQGVDRDEADCCTGWRTTLFIAGEDVVEGIAGDVEGVAGDVEGIGGDVEGAEGDVEGRRMGGDARYYSLIKV